MRDIEFEKVQEFVKVIGNPAYGWFDYDQIPSGGVNYNRYAHSYSKLESRPIVIRKKEVDKPIRCNQKSILEVMEEQRLLSLSKKEIERIDRERREHNERLLNKYDTKKYFRPRKKEAVKTSDLTPDWRSKNKINKPESHTLRVSANKKDYPVSDRKQSQDIRGRFDLREKDTEDNQPEIVAVEPKYRNQYWKQQATLLITTAHRWGGLDMPVHVRSTNIWHIQDPFFKMTGEYRCRVKKEDITERIRTGNILYSVEHHSYHTDNYPYVNVYQATVVKDLEDEYEIRFTFIAPLEFSLIKQTA